MKPLWHGSLNFELVTIPIGLYPATRRRRVPLRLLHEPDLAPIRMLKICGQEERPVPTEEIVRGYQLDDRWIVVTPTELDAAAPGLTRTIEIREFIDEREIDPIYYQRPYYLAPDEGGEDQFVVLREAIRRSGKVGLAEFVLMRRQHLAVLRPRGEALVLETLFYPEELIDERDLELSASTRLREGEIRMAAEVIELRARQPSDFSRYRDEYRERLMGLIREKAAGQLPAAAAKPVPPAPTPIIDLPRRLRESLERARREEARRAA